MSLKPLWEFGHGLSYTRFEYSNLRIEPRETSSSLEVEVSAEVRNAGAREGAEVVQLYINDVLASVSRPVKELRGFRRITLKPGGMQTVRFKLAAHDLSLIDASLERVVEPGVFRVMVGRSSEDLPLQGGFEVKTRRVLPKP
jgi:beta-glucosidase